MIKRESEKISDVEHDGNGFPSCFGQFNLDSSCVLCKSVFDCIDYEFRKEGLRIDNRDEEI